MSSIMIPFTFFYAIVIHPFNFTQDGASAAGGKTNPDTVAPGEDDPDAEKNKLDVRQKCLVFMITELT